MFYSQFILAKKGPLGTIWIAAHLERKLRKNQVTETNIGVSVDSILFPEVPIALRLSGHLLLGVVRIYSRKVNYLFHDCSEALVKIKQAFHSGAVDLPPEAATAPFHSITLPENFDFDDLELLPDREALFLANNSSVDHHVTSREQITLQDTVDDSTYLGNQFGLDDRLDAPRLELDEDVLPTKTSDLITGDREENPVLEEDLLPAVDEQDDPLEDEDRHRAATPPPGNIEVLDSEMLNVPDLNEEQPLPPEPEPEPEAGADDLPQQQAEQPETSKQAATPLDINVVPDLPTALLDEGAAPAPEAEPGQQQQAETNEEPGVPAAVEQAELPSPAEGAATEEPHRDENEQDARVEETETDADKTQPAGDGEPEAKGSTELNDVPEIEKLRSAVDVPEPEQNILDPGVTFESAQKLAEATPGEDASKIQESAAQETPLLKEDVHSSALRPSPSAMDSAGDDDVLASILGRRSLRVAPTPELPPAKRQKPGPKPGSKKRKAQVDEATVLHADDMRQQLSDTTDIRRVRKRAPCNEYEIWNSEKEVQGQQIFDEPLVLGFCENIRQIYRCIYSVGDAKVSVESETTELSGKHKQQHQLDCVESGEAITLPLDEYDLYDDFQRVYRFDEDLEDQSLAELREVRRGGDSSAVKEKIIETAVQEKIIEAPVQEQQDNPPQANDEEKEKEAADERPELPAAAADDERVAADEGPAETPVSEKAESNVCNSSPENTTSSEHASNDEQIEAQAEVKEAAAGEPETIEEVPQPEAMEVDVTDTSQRLETEAQQEPMEPEPEPVQAVEDNPVEHEEHPNTEIPAAAEATTVQSEEPAQEPQEQRDVVVEDPDQHQHQELVFLTDAKDEEGNDDENEYDGDYSGAQVQDNSGWSVRTRAVCQYLRNTFEGMEQSKGRKLNLDRLLQGKTRRECARMFFESLVLKSKDYINVEQSAPFGNIYISARSKLMKADL